MVAGARQAQAALRIRAPTSDTTASRRALLALTMVPSPSPGVSLWTGVWPFPVPVPDRWLYRSFAVARRARHGNAPTPNPSPRRARRARLGEGARGRGAPGTASLEVISRTRKGYVGLRSERPNSIPTWVPCPRSAGARRANAPQAKGMPAGAKVAAIRGRRIVGLSAVVRRDGASLCRAFPPVEPSPILQAPRGPPRVPRPVGGPAR